jgi:hypothetical protein
LEARGGSELTIYGKSTHEVERLTLTNTGRSTGSVTATATETLVESSGGGRTRLRGEGKRMSVYLTERSHLEADNFSLHELSFRMTEESRASVQVHDRARGRASGESVLSVRGACTLHGETSGNSSINRL